MHDLLVLAALVAPPVAVALVALDVYAPPSEHGHDGHDEQHHDRGSGGRPPDPRS